ncbi:hypothetical protein ACFYZJ_37815 [Streptomyces sp. NPDC001848]|uniref:hypothetical protein n=1 Tax=Streptomyces sp. NPDC001848 TaxID=3364618 RepID=UPI0036A5354E
MTNKTPLPAIPLQPTAADKSEPAAPVERSLSLVLEAEVMMDDDNGMLSLVASTDHHLSDFGEVAPARLRRMVAEARAKLDEFERLANEYEAIDTLRAIVAEHHLHVEEWDLANQDPQFRSKFVAFAALTEDGQRVVVVPKGQDPVKRLAAVAELVREMDGEV